MTNEYRIHKAHFTGTFGDTLEDIHTYVDAVACYLAGTIILRNFTVYNVLDVGASDGYLLDQLLKLKPSLNVLGIDPEPDSEKVKKSEAHKISGVFDLVTYNHVLEHIMDLEFEMKSIRRLLRRGGLLFVSVPYGGSPWAYEYEGHYQVFYPPNLNALLACFGFRIEQQFKVNFRRDCEELWTLAILE